MIAINFSKNSGVALFIIHSFFFSSSKRIVSWIESYSIFWLKMSRILNKFLDSYNGKSLMILSAILLKTLGSSYLKSCMPIANWIRFLCVICPTFLVASLTVSQTHGWSSQSCLPLSSHFPSSIRALINSVLLRNFEFYKFKRISFPSIFLNQM